MKKIKELFADFSENSVAENIGDFNVFDNIVQIAFGFYVNANIILCVSYGKAVRNFLEKYGLDRVGKVFEISFFKSFRNLGTCFCTNGFDCLRNLVGHFVGRCACAS